MSSEKFLECLINLTESSKQQLSCVSFKFHKYAGLAFLQLMRNWFCNADTQSTNISLYSVKDIEQYLNTILQCSDTFCENDKYVFLFQGRLIITFCTLSCFVCSRSMPLFVVPFSLFSFAD